MSDTFTLELTRRELEEIRTAILLSQEKTIGYPFEDDETKEILEVLGSAKGKADSLLEE